MGCSTLRSYSLLCTTQARWHCNGVDNRGFVLFHVSFCLQVNRAQIFQAGFCRVTSVAEVQFLFQLTKMGYFSIVIIE